MEENNNIRKNLSFNANDQKQRLAAEALTKLGRKQAKYVAELIWCVLQKNQITDLNELSKEELMYLISDFCTTDKQENPSKLFEAMAEFFKNVNHIPESEIKKNKEQMDSEKDSQEDHEKTVSHTPLIENHLMVENEKNDKENAAIPSDLFEEANDEDDDGLQPDVFDAFNDF